MAAAAHPMNSMAIFDMDHPERLCAASKYGRAHCLRLHSVRREGEEMRLVIIGGSDARISAALRARELDSAQVCVIVSDAYPNFSICGLPSTSVNPLPSG